MCMIDLWEAKDESDWDNSSNNYYTEEFMEDNSSIFFNYDYKPDWLSSTRNLKPKTKQNKTNYGVK